MESFRRGFGRRASVLSIGPFHLLRSIGSDWRGFFRPRMPVIKGLEG
jgi:hypothetical protein